jgi:hypothetical protein
LLGAQLSGSLLFYGLIIHLSMSIWMYQDEDTLKSSEEFDPSTPLIVLLTLIGTTKLMWTIISPIGRFLWYDQPAVLLRHARHCD